MSGPGQVGGEQEGVWGKVGQGPCQAKSVDPALNPWPKKAVEQAQKNLKPVAARASGRCGLWSVLQRKERKRLRSNVPTVHQALPM